MSAWIGSTDSSEPSGNQPLVSDFTYVSTWQGWLYLAFVIDMFTRRIVDRRVGAQGPTSHRLSVHVVNLHKAEPSPQVRVPHDRVEGQTQT